MTIARRVGAARSPHACAVLLVAAVVGAALPVAAQTTTAPAPLRQNGAVFGGDAETRDGLSLFTSVYAGHDDDLSALQGQGNASSGGTTPGNGGYYGGVLAGLRFQTGVTAPRPASGRGARRPAFGGSASTEFRHYEGLSGLRAAQHNGDLSLTTPVGRSGQLRLGQTAAYSPFYSFALVGADFPSTEVGSAADGRLTARDTLSLDSTVDYTYRRSVRTSVNALYGFRYLDIADAPGFKSQRAGVRITRLMTRYAGLRLGYIYEEADQRFLAGALTPVPGTPETPAVPAAAVRLHNIDTGLDYRRPLSFSRRTTVGVSTGMVFSQQVAFNSFDIIGNATVEHQLGRSWTVGGTYRRGVRFIEVIATPVLENAYRASLTGLLLPRLDLTAGVDYAAGSLNAAASATNVGYTSLAGTARLRLAIARALALYGEYAYYNYDFDSGIVLPADVATAITRGTVRVGLTLYVPLRSERVSRGSR